MKRFWHDSRPDGIPALESASKPGFIFLGFGVVLPLLVVVLEFSTHMCAAEFFDPIPTIPHLLAVAFVPLANLLVWIFARGGVGPSIKVLGVANGIAIGVSLYYSLLFVPLLPLAMLAVIWGIGFLPMAPLFSFLAAVRGRKYIRTRDPGETGSRVPGNKWGLIAALLVIIVLDLPVTATRVAMKWASSPTHETSMRGIRLLRAIGDEEVILRSCYRRTGLATDLVSLGVFRGNPIAPRDARKLYYRVTGNPYNSVPPPQEFIKAMRPFGEWNPDMGLGGNQVAGRVRGLFLESSRLDGSVDADAALAYMEWTMVFRNDSSLMREARAQIVLPPGGVVSRLTLWIEGEEREAAFAARGKVRKAYSKVVRKRRDPVLVTTTGPDRVLLQCFPVLPGGETMKVRLGISIPLAIPNKKRSFLRLPHFTERNFSMAAATKHSVWIESRNLLTSKHKSLRQERPSFSVFAIRGMPADSELSDPGCSIETARPPDVVVSWALDKTVESGALVTQTLEEKPITAPTRVVLVVDGSQPMSMHRDEILGALKTLPDGIELALILASDQPVEVLKPTRARDDEVLDKVTKSLSRKSFQGGCDNVPALTRAWFMAAERAHSAIVWVHGPQPLEVSTIHALRQCWERRPGNPLLNEVTAIPGPNRILEKLEGINSVRSVARFGKLQTDLERLFSRWRPNSTRIVPNREANHGTEKDLPEHAHKTSDHLVRLWAHERVLGLTDSRNQADFQKAVQIAAQYRLVTPVTGAVVLETQQQYSNAGLTPATPGEVPTVPEPETWALIAVALLSILFAVHRRRGRCQVV